MWAFIFAVLACLNASAADSSFKKGNLIYGLLCTALTAFCIWRLLVLAGLA